MCVRIFVRHRCHRFFSCRQQSGSGKASVGPAQRLAWQCVTCGISPIRGCDCSGAGRARQMRMRMVAEAAKNSSAQVSSRSEESQEDTHLLREPFPTSCMRPFFTIGKNFPSAPLIAIFFPGVRIATVPASITCTSSWSTSLPPVWRSSRRRGPARLPEAT